MWTAQSTSPDARSKARVSGPGDAAAIQERAGFGGADSIEARRHARAALEEFRRWSGPSEEALGELVDLEILDGNIATAVELALPSTVGGSASDREAAAAPVARSGASAALVSGRADALAVFRSAFDGDPYLAQLAAQELEFTHAALGRRQQAWRQALRTADDDRNRASCILRLAELSVWPIAEADDMLADQSCPNGPIAWPRRSDRPPPAIPRERFRNFEPWRSTESS
jgi:hypothetical protein